MNVSWTLDEGLNLVRALQQETRQFGYHLALGGGVLNNGKSDKDIDLYFLPLDNSKQPTPDPHALLAWLTKMWGDSTPIGADYPDEVEVPQAQPIGQWLNENQQPVFNQVADNPWGIFQQIRQKSLTSKYSMKVTFVRKDGDRIDVFIM